LIIKEWGLGPTIYGRASLFFAIIGFLSLFSLFPALLVYDLFVFYLSLLLVIELLAMFLGVFSYWIKKPPDDDGKLGFSIGLIFVIIELLAITVLQYYLGGMTT
ncbi:MAG: hypothetical protein NTV74_03760, partial [Euryarchaeota archaeon]|nr:hypothetical protein [Euryarchaeota archaeon]